MTGQDTVDVTDTQPGLRIGLAFDGAPEPWVLRLVERICTEDGMQLVALIAPGDTSQAPPSAWMFKALMAIEKRIIARPLAANAPLSDAALKALKHVSDTNTDILKPLNMDVVLDFSGRANVAALGTVSNHGVWSLDICIRPDQSAGYQATAKDVPASTFALLQTTLDHSHPRIIATGALNSKVFATRNTLLMKEKAPIMILRELRRLRDTGHVEHLADYQPPAFKTPGLIGLSKYFLRIIGGVFDWAWEKVAADILRTRPGMFFLKTGTGNILNFDPDTAATVDPQGNHYWADPYLYERDGETYCFFEDYDYQTHQGYLCVGRFDGDKLVEVKDAIKTDYHLSYPFLFEEGGELFMLPETHQTQRLEIWRCTDFPYQWELHATALEGVIAADTSLNLIDGQWWLFSNISSDITGEQNSELHVFQIDGPSLNTIIPHKLNPVVLDSRTARNAGRIHCLDGRIFRPSQDNAFGLYGYGLNIMEIEELSLDQYREKRIRHIQPDLKSGIIGCHHFDAVGDRFIIDVRRKSGGRPVK